MEAALEQLIDFWTRLSLNRKIVVLAATIGMFFAILALTRVVSAPSMSLLYAGLDPSTAGEVVSSLEQRGANFEVRGSSIFVAANERDELRMTLASEGLPANSAGGYELLDNLSGFGTTSQMFDAAYWRAKEGELARTIVSSQHISSARVHIAQTNSGPFSRGVAPTASVSVTPLGGELTANQAKALKFLVASAVAGLSPDSVAVINSDGELFTSQDDSTPADANADHSDRLKEKVERLLEARVGPGNVVVEVSVETVLESEAIRERLFDPETRFAISTDTEERSNSSNQSGEQVTVASNLPDGDAGGGEASSSQTNETRERVNYEVSETEREVVRSPGAIKRLSVAVLVNGREELAADGSSAIVERDETEMASLLELVESAVGYREDRGDVVTLKSMQMVVAEPRGTLVESSFMSGLAIDIMSAIQTAVLAIVILILGLFVVRPILAGAGTPAQDGSLLLADGVTGGEGAASGSLGSTEADVGAGDALPSFSSDGGFPSLDGDLPDLPMMGGMMAEESPAERLRNMIEERQTETVEILRSWLEDKEEAA